MPSRASPETGKLSPEALKLVVLSQASLAFEESPGQVEALARSLERDPGTLRDFLYQMGRWSPQELRENLEEANPSLPLDSSLERLPPLEMLKALVRVALPDRVL